MNIKSTGMCMIHAGGEGFGSCPKVVGGNVSVIASWVPKHDAAISKCGPFCRGSVPAWRRKAPEGRRRSNRNELLP